MSSTHQTRVVLIEDHDLERIAMRMTLERQPGISVVGVAANGREGAKLVTQLHPHLAIVDLGLPDIDGVEVTRRIKALPIQDAPIKVLILTLWDHEEMVLAAFGAGADSYCIKGAPKATLLEAVQVTMEGYSWIDPIIAGIVLQQARMSSRLDAPDQKSEDTIQINAAKPEYNQILDAYPLTDRELEVLQLIVEGQSNAEIAEQLHITIGTVKTHVRNILNKLCADDRTQAAVRALRAGLVR